MAMHSTHMDRALVHGAGEMAPVSEINVVPFIDIMLVLLIIFMVTAPLMLGGVNVNLPKTTGQPMPRPDQPLIISLDAESRVFVDKEEVAAESRREHFKRLARGSAEVYVRGDGEVKYARVMELIAELGQAGFARVTLVTSVTGDQPRGDEAGPGPAVEDQTAANQAQAAEPRP